MKCKLIPETMEGHIEGCGRTRNAQAECHLNERNIASCVLTLPAFLPCKHLELRLETINTVLGKRGRHFIFKYCNGHVETGFETRDAEKSSLIYVRVTPKNLQ